MKRSSRLVIRRGVAQAIILACLFITLSFGRDIADLKRSINSLNSFAADFKLLEYSRMDTITTTGNIWIDFEPKSLRYETAKQVIIFKDGEVITYRKGTKTAVKRRRLEQKDIVILDNLIAKLEQKFELRMSDANTLHGTSRDDGSTIESIWVEFNAANIPVKLGWQNVLGYKTEHIFQNIETDTPLSEELFKLDSEIEIIEIK